MEKSRAAAPHSKEANASAEAKQGTADQRELTDPARCEMVSRMWAHAARVEEEKTDKTDERVGKRSWAGPKEEPKPIN